MPKHPFRPPDRRVGKDPDYRFSLANERTFLAWIRTSLALVGGGLAVAEFLPSASTTLRDAIGLVLVVIGTAMAAASFARWTRNEDAMRNDRPIPASVLPMLLSIGVLVVAALVALLLFQDA